MVDCLSTNIYNYSLAKYFIIVAMKSGYNIMYYYVYIIRLGI